MIGLLVLLMAQWVESTIIGTHLGNSKAPLAVYIGGDFGNWNDADAVPGPMASDVWYTLTLPVPADTNAVFLSGMLVISASSTPSPLLGATFREPGDTTEPQNYTFYTIGTGVRSPASAFVPVNNRHVEFRYHRTPGCECLINLSLQAYVRNGVIRPPPDDYVVSATMAWNGLIVQVHGPGNLTDWVSVCRNTCTWQYLNGTHVAPTTALTDATLLFPAVSGIYQVTFYANDGFLQLGNTTVVVP